MKYSAALVQAFALAASAMPVSDNNAPVSALEGLAARQEFGGCVETFYNKVKGDGSPYQSYLYTQVTSPLDCHNNPACEIASTEIEGKSIAWSMGFGLSGERSGLGGFISGGFEVTEYQEVGETRNCAGDAEQIICVYQRVAHTTFQAEEWVSNTCIKDDVKRADVTINAPNKNWQGSTFICSQGSSCKSKGQEFWGGAAYPGGPQDYPFEKDPELS